MTRPRRQSAARGDDGLRGFQPCVRRWFRRTFAAPSPAQTLGWPAIRRGENVLLLAPTGSGKTLAAFLSAIDDLVRRARANRLDDVVHVLYVTPLKALGHDIHRNLHEPLAAIQDEADDAIPPIRVAVRTGDTTPNERERMVRRPPHILITTPESLYLLLGSRRWEGPLAAVRTVIVDEVHALCDNKRGVHLAVSLERLARGVPGDMQRIGCSATLSPLDTIARFLVGNDPSGRHRPCTIVDAGQRKDLDVRVMAPLPDFLEAGHTALWASAYDLLLRAIREHDTTLVFCNSRYKAERTALRLAEGADDATRIGVHHGSMSKETRADAEADLKAGRLDALVATSSLELGIDIGSVNLVYQLESPRSVSTGLQRVGRAGHLLDATSRGRVLAFERDELMEAAAVCRGMTGGAIDDVQLPRDCLDVLAQQIAGAVSRATWAPDDLFALVRRAWPYARLPRAEFDAVVGMLAGERSFEMAEPPRPLVLWDRASDRLSAARGTAHVCAMGVGTIAETGEYDVVIADSKRRVGRVQSEFVDDALRTDDVFVLGSSAWRVAGKQRNRLLVTPAPGATPTVPWWHGRVESRTVLVGRRVGALRRSIASGLDDPDLARRLETDHHLDRDAALALIDYVREQRHAIGVVPDHERVLVETWCDELGKLNVLVHCPLGQRVNRTWGETIAAAARRDAGQTWSVTASNDLLMLTLQCSPASSADAIDAPALLARVTTANADELAASGAASVVASGSAFRQVATCALQVQRAYGGRRVPLWLQDHRADELFAAAAGDGDYPLFTELRRAHVRDSLDVPGLLQLLTDVETGTVSLAFHAVEAPSPFAHALLLQGAYRQDHQMGRERRAHLLRLQREVLREVLSTEQMAQLLDRRAIEQVARRVGRTSEHTRARSSDELAQVIHDLGDVPANLTAVARLVQGKAAALLGPLLDAGRVVAIELGDCEQDPMRLVAGDRWRQYHDAFARGRTRRGGRLTVHRPRLCDDALDCTPVAAAANVIPARWRRPGDPRTARRAVVQRYLQCDGPLTSYEIVNRTGWSIAEVESILKALVDDGIAARGVYTDDRPRPQWINRANLEQIHKLTMGFLRRELAACAPAEVVDFVTRWQHRHPATRLAGVDGLRTVIAQLQGFEVLQGALESEVLPQRVHDYRPPMLEGLISSGEVCWCRVGSGRVRRGPVTLCLRRDMGWLGSAGPQTLDVAAEADADIRDEILAVRAWFGANRIAFFDDVVAACGGDEGPVLRAVWYLAWCGELTCDTFDCLRYAGLDVSVSACYDLANTPRKIVAGRLPAANVIRQMRRKNLDPRLGRWSATERLVPPDEPPARAEVARRWASLLLRRWGIVTRDLLAAECAAPRWAALVPAFKRLEMLGQVSRGYYIESHHGEQFGTPEAVELLRDCRARRDGPAWVPDEPLFWISNRDPANLYGRCLPLLDGRGESFRERQIQGNLIARFVMQAGQPLIAREHLLIGLSRAQLAPALVELLHDSGGPWSMATTTTWNAHPIHLSPVAPLLRELGFDPQEALPSFRKDELDATQMHQGGSPERFEPWYHASSSAMYGPRWTVEHAAPGMRWTVARLLETLIPEIERRRWTVEWSARGPAACYGGAARVDVHIANYHVDVRVGTHTLRAGKSREVMHAWDDRNRLRVCVPSRIDDAFLADLRRLLTNAEDIAKRIRAARRKRRRARGAT